MSDKKYFVVGCVVLLIIFLFGLCLYFIFSKKNDVSGNITTNPATTNLVTTTENPAATTNPATTNPAANTAYASDFRMDWNMFYHPMIQGTSVTTGCVPYDPQKEMELQKQLGSKLYPEYPCKTVKEAF